MKSCAWASFAASVRRSRGAAGSARAIFSRTVPQKIGGSDRTLVRPVLRLRLEQIAQPIRREQTVLQLVPKPQQPRRGYREHDHEALEGHELAYGQFAPEDQVRSQPEQQRGSNQVKCPKE